MEAISSHLGFPTLSIKCVFVCGRQEVKGRTGCQVSECCNEGLGQSQGLFMFWQMADSTAEDYQVFLFLSFTLVFCTSSCSTPSCFLPSSFIVFFLLSPQFLTHSFSSRSLNLCILFPLSAVSLPYCPSFFPPSLCQSCWMFLVASCSASLPFYAQSY